MRTVVRKSLTTLGVCAVIGAGVYFVYPLLDTPRHAEAATEVAQAETQEAPAAEPAPEGTSGRVQPSGAAEEGDPWRVICSDPAAETPRRCILQQALFARQTGQKVISATIARNGDDPQPLIEFGLPHGLLLLEGIKLAVDDKEAKNVQIRTADQNGSYAIAPLDDALLTQFRDGQLLRVSVTSAAGDPITFEMSLEGFSRAFDEL